MQCLVRLAFLSVYVLLIRQRRVESQECLSHPATFP